MLFNTKELGVLGGLPPKNEKKPRLTYDDLIERQERKEKAR